MKQIIIAGIFGVAMLLAGCSSKNLNTQEATQNTIYQTLQSKQEWKIHSFKLNNTTEVLTFEKEYPFFIGFKEKGVFGTFGCNNFFGSYDLNNDNLKISNAGMTRKMCEPRIMELESKLTENVLKNENRVEILNDGKILIFRNDFYLLMQ